MKRGDYAVLLGVLIAVVGLFLVNILVNNVITGNAAFDSSNMLERGYEKVIEPPVGSGAERLIVGESFLVESQGGKIPLAQVCFDEEDQRWINAQIENGEGVIDVRFDSGNKKCYSNVIDTDALGLESSPEGVEHPYRILVKK